MDMQTKCKITVVDSHVQNDTGIRGSFLNVEVTLARECTKPLTLLQSRVVGVGSRNFCRGSARVDVRDNVWGDYTLGGGTKGVWERMRAHVVRLVICNVCVDVGTYRKSIRYSTSRTRTPRRVA